MQRESDAGTDAIAIVGMACRFPGAWDLPAFWHQLDGGADAVTDERRESDIWNDFVDDLPKRYAGYSRAGFVDGIDQFDARFFGLSPIAARLMDPQQRMLLETTWQALEDAGIDPDRLRGSAAGVYAGINTSEYRDLMREGDYGTSYLGTAASMAVGHLAFSFGLSGPTLPVQLNCASSLVAVHQAVIGLRLGETDLALVGGTSAALSAGITKEMTELRLLSPQGRCKSFDASADGFVRGEGCGMVVLKRLSEAEADGDRIWAVIRGSAVNQNGASAGATMPNGPAQERVIEQALSQAALNPSEVDYLEAHGAGSAFGDPIEVQAAAAVYGRARDADRPLLMGSVKTNIGHLEAAAGIAGLIKTVLAMTHRVIPQHLHFENPSTLVEWEKLPVLVTSEAVDWPADANRPPRAGVSAFGISGVNAHVVLEGYGAANDIAGAGSGAASPSGPAQPVAIAPPEGVARPPQDEAGLAPRPARMLPLSAKSEDALRELAVRYLAWLDERSGEISPQAGATDSLLSDMAWTAGVGRSHLAYRAAVVFSDAASLRDRLTALAEAAGGPEPLNVTKVAFVYPGEGGRWAGTGTALHETEPVVRAVLERCEAVFQDEWGKSLLDGIIARAGSAGAPDHGAWPGPTIYALECALTALWASVGVRPSVVAGHGAGEIAAAQAAGVFGLEDGLRLAATGEDAEALLEGISLNTPSLSLMSGPSGRLVEPDQALDAAYWLRQAAGAPLPLGSVSGALADQGVEVVVEIGPSVVLAPLMPEAWPKTAQRSAPPAALSSPRRPARRQVRTAGDACGGIVDAVAEIYEAGLPIDFAGLFAGETRRRIALPGYPFQRRRYWLPKPAAHTAAAD